MSEKEMTTEELLQILTDPENQPHQYVGDINSLARKLDKIIKDHYKKQVFPFSKCV